ncbi:MAG: ubiquinone/menaquinone biosynthesis methyltransferase, partial [Verrucomicrobiaceae bacterium]|nr:ubiquinone/menaquinone biosynthesis methyltransferase [Verrucomicrobiaceae bacterium]
LRPHAMQDAGFVKQAFAGIAKRYVVTNHVLSLGVDVIWRWFTAKLVASYKPEWVLDLATGSGDLAQAIQKACPQARVLGGDFSPPMMMEAQKRGFHHLIAADGLALPVKDDAFDVVTVAFGLRNMASWPKALQEMSRVLRPGGHLVVLDFSLPRLPVLRPLYVFYLEKVMPKLAGAITGQRAAFEYLCRSIESFPSGKDMEALMMANGFAEATSRPLSLGIATLYSARKAV